MVKLIRLSKEKFFIQLSSNANNPQQFWKVVNSTKANKAAAIPSLTHDNVTLTTDLEKAGRLKTFFWECFNRSDISTMQFPAEFDGESSDDWSLLEVAEEQVVLISSLPSRKSPEVDGITAEML